jgi:hypothetical protein
MERFFRIRPLAAFLAVSLMGNVCVQAEASISGLQQAELVTAIGRLSVIAANVADNKGLSAAKYLHVAADSIRLLNEIFYLINKGTVVKEGAYYSFAWMVADICNLAKDVQKCVKQAPVLISDIQTQSDVADSKFEKIGRHLATYILPSAEATLAAYLALSNGNLAKNKKARVVAKSLESLSRSLQFFLSKKRNTPEAKLGLAVVVTNLALLLGYESFKSFSDSNAPTPVPPVTQAVPAVTQPAQTTQPVATTAEQPVASAQTPVQTNASTQQSEVPETQPTAATQVAVQPVQTTQPVATTVEQPVASAQTPVQTNASTQQSEVPATQPTAATQVAAQPVQTTQNPTTPSAPAQTNTSVQQLIDASAAEAKSATQVVEQTAQPMPSMVMITPATPGVQTTQQEVRSIAPRTVNFQGKELNVDEYFEKRANGNWYYKKALGRSMPNTKIGSTRMGLLVQLNALQ